MLGQSRFARARFSNDSKAFSPRNPKGDLFKGFDFPRTSLIIDVGKMLYFNHSQWSRDMKFPDFLREYPCP